jgi:heme-degrading monooxygenase HmoA
MAMVPAVPRYKDIAHKFAQERGGSIMICRMWHGRTPRSKADAYTRFLEQRAIPDYRSVPGNLNVAIMRRDEEGVTHFLTVTHWDSEASIRAFAGDEPLKAKYYPEDLDFLLEFEDLVQHYTVTAHDGGA